MNQNHYERVKEILDNLSDGKYTTECFVGRDDWLKGRRKSLGASDASAVLGINPWMTEVDLWNDKRGNSAKKDDGDNDDIIRGNRSEKHIRAMYEIEIGCDVLDGTGIILRSIHNPFMSCTLDGIIINANISPTILEIKSVRKGGGEWTDETVPQHYLAQVLHQLAVTGWSEAILRARFASNKDYETAYERSYHFLRADYEDMIEKLIAKERKFWNENVIGGKRPGVRVPTI